MIFLLFSQWGPLICVVAECRGPEVPENGGVNYDRNLITYGYPEGTTASFYCNAGYYRFGAWSAKCFFAGTTYGWTYVTRDRTECRGKENKMQYLLL